MGRDRSPVFASTCVSCLHLHSHCPLWPTPPPSLGHGLELKCLSGLLCLLQLGSANTRPQLEIRDWEKHEITHLVAIGWLQPCAKGHSYRRLSSSSPTLSGFQWPLALLQEDSENPHFTIPTGRRKPCPHITKLSSNARFGCVYCFLPTSWLSSLF